MNVSKLKTFRIFRLKFLLRIAIIVLILIAFYALFGFFGLPRIVKPRLSEKIAELTGRQVELENIKINPFVLSTTLINFELKEPNGEEIIGFKELYVNLQFSSLFRRAFTIKELRLTSPFVSVKVQSDGTVNLYDLIKRNNDSSKEEKKDGPLPLVFEYLVVEDGRIKFEDLSHPTPFVEEMAGLNFSLRNITTRPEGEGVYQFQAITERGAIVKWKGSIDLIPLGSKGDFELSGIKALRMWEYLQDQLYFEITGGELKFTGSYELDLTEDGNLFRLNNVKIGINSLSLNDRENNSEIINWSQLNVNGLELDYPKRQVQIDNIQGSSAIFRGVLQKDGSFNLSKMLLVKTLGEITEQPEEETKHGDRWQVSVVQIELKDYAIKFEDQGTKPATQIELSPITLKVEGLKLGTPGKAKIDLQIGVNNSGTIRVNGDLEPEPLSADLELQLTELGLKPFQPYINRFINIDVKTGSLALNGNLNYSMSDSKRELEFKGDLKLGSARVTDPTFAEDFFRWDQLEFKNINYRLTPQSLTIQEIIAQNLYSRIIIGKDNKTNIQEILVKRDESNKDNGEAQKTRSQFKFRVEEVKVINGSMNFSDLTITPHFVTGIQELNGSIRELSSEQLAHAQVDLKGKVDKYAPVTIKGKINPLSEEAYTDIDLKFQGIGLSNFTPYSGKYAGYEIDKGKLTLELNYKLNKNLLEGKNHIVMDQFTLGAKVVSPDATNLPVKLAIALLKDSKGMIDINIPVSGDLNDPEFSFGQIIIKAFVNLIVKAIKSPFSLIGSLFGGGEELGYINFSPGSSILNEEQQSKLEKLVKALNERPNLRVDLRGMAVEPVDRYALAKQALMEQVGDQDNAEADEPLTKKERKRLLKLYKKTFNEDPLELVGPINEEGNKLSKDDRKASAAKAALRRLVEEYPVSNDDMLLIARQRAVAVKDYLIQQGGVNEPRIFLLDVDTQISQEDGEVQMPLELNAL